MDIDISLIFGDAARWIMPVLALLVAAFCVPSLLKGNKKIGVTGYLVNEANGDRLPLSGYEVSVGRSKACDIVLGYNTVSRFHAVLSKHKNGWRVNIYQRREDRQAPRPRGRGHDSFRQRGVRVRRECGYRARTGSGRAY